MGADLKILSSSKEHPRPNMENFKEELKELLETYRDVFEEPKRLPPSRTCDHKIPPLDVNKLVNSHSYNHPHAHKGIIEATVKEMVEAGTIRESSSPFASPVILVKKKDSTWRLCVDYRGLNAMTVMNRPRLSESEPRHALIGAHL